jgi:hypothetical protein
MAVEEVSLQPLLLQDQLLCLETSHRPRVRLVRQAQARPVLQELRGRPIVRRQHQYQIFNLLPFHRHSRFPRELLLLQCQQGLNLRRKFCITNPEIRVYLRVYTHLTKSFLLLL